MPKLPRNKNTGSRVFHGLMVVPSAFLCLMALISFSCFAYEHDKIRKSLQEKNRHADYCILFMKSGPNDTLIPASNDNPCALAIWGGVTIFFLSIIFGVWFIVKILIALKAVSVFSFVEFGGLALGTLLDFTVAVVISAGLQQSCDAFKDNKDCSNHYLTHGDDKFYFYQKINSAKATAWIGTATLVVMAVIYFILMSTYCYRKVRPKKPVPYDGFSNDEDENVEDDSDDKPIPV